MVKLRKFPKKLNIWSPIKSFFTSFRGIMISLVLVGVLAFSASGYFWYTNMLTDSKHVFEGMLSESLQTNSVVRTVNQDTALKTVEQSYYVSFPRATAESVTTIEQVGQDRQKTVVKTATIGTRNSDYVQYSDIQIPQLIGKKDTSKLVGQWARRDSNPKTGETTQFLSESIFMFVPFGNFKPSDRQTLLDLMKKNQTYIYKQQGNVDFSSGRPTMTYHVTINPKSLVEVLSEYVKITGIGDPAQLNPADYEGSSNVDVEMTIDVLTRHIKDVKFLADSRKESYSSYGLDRNVVLPKQTITVEELQNRLQVLN